MNKTSLFRDFHGESGEGDVLRRILSSEFIQLLRRLDFIAGMANKVLSAYNSNCTFIPYFYFSDLLGRTEKKEMDFVRSSLDIWKKRLLLTVELVSFTVCFTYSCSGSLYLQEGHPLSFQILLTY